MKNYRNDLNARKEIARRLVAELSGAQAADLGFIYENFAKYLFGIEFETFSSYLAPEN